jgi:hypothetical protein
MVSAAQNQMQEGAYESEMQVQRMAIAKRYAISKEFRVGSIGAALLGINPEKGAAAEAAVYKVLETPKEMMNYAGAAVTNYFQGVEADVVRWFRTAIGRPAELGLLPTPQNYSNPLYHTAYVGGQKIEVMSKEDEEYARKHGMTREEAINKAILSSDYRSVSPLSKRDPYYYLSHSWQFKIGNFIIGTDYTHAIWNEVSDYFKLASQSIGSPELVKESKENIRKILGHDLPQNALETEKVIKAGGAAYLSNLQAAGYSILKTYAGKTAKEKFLETASERYNKEVIEKLPAVKGKVEKELQDIYVKRYGKPLSEVDYARYIGDSSKAAEAITNPAVMTKALASLLGAETGEEAGERLLSHIAFISNKEQRTRQLQTVENIIQSESRSEAMKYLEKNLNMSATEASLTIDFLRNPANLKTLLNYTTLYNQANPSTPSPSNKAQAGTTNLGGTPNLETSIDDLTKVLPKVVEDFKNMSESLKKQGAK